MQLTSSLMMVRPVRFGFNPETAETNTFQEPADERESGRMQAEALAEFDAFVKKLREAGVYVAVMQDPGVPHTPDSLFPNNWVSFHEDGRVVLYPMQAHNRRQERRRSFLESLEKEHGFAIKELIDLSYFEEQFKYLEGTGSMNLDRVNKIAYACLSPRTHPEVLQEFCKLLGYTPVVFHAANKEGVPIYHTNVLMSVGEKLAIICLESLTDPDEAAYVLQQLEATGKLVIPITMEQMNHFAGNMLHICNQEGEPLLVLSEQAWQSLDENQVIMIGTVTNVLHANLSSIERYGGGSARCMMAEVFLPKNHG